MRAASRLSTSDQLRVPAFFMSPLRTSPVRVFPVKGVCMEVYT
jgi:hypothetical protein